MESGHEMLDHPGSYQASRRRREPVPALPPYLIEPIWQQFEALLPEREVDHPLGCHRPRIPDRVLLRRQPPYLARLNSGGDGVGVQVLSSVRFGARFGFSTGSHRSPGVRHARIRRSRPGSSGTPHPPCMSSPTGFWRRSPSRLASRSSVGSCLASRSRPLRAYPGSVDAAPVFKLYVVALLSGSRNVVQGRGEAFIADDGQAAQVAGFDLAAKLADASDGGPYVAV